MEKELVPIKDRYMLTVNEAGAYFNIGVKRIRRILAEHPGQFSVNCGSKQMVMRHKFEKFIDETSEI